MTITIWEDWLVKINNYLRRRSRKVLLLVDNAPGHNIKKETKNLIYILIKVPNPVK
jgi:hypothetical protein